jgi:hypothetical protein
MLNLKTVSAILEDKILVNQGIKFVSLLIFLLTFSTMSEVFAQNYSTNLGGVNEGDVEQYCKTRLHPDSNIVQLYPSGTALCQVPSGREYNGSVTGGFPWGVSGSLGGSNLDYAVNKVVSLNSVCRFKYGNRNIFYNWRSQQCISIYRLVR